MRHRILLATLAAGALASGLAATPATAQVPDGPSGPVIFDGGQWLARTTASGGSAQLNFRYGRTGDVPVVGDWDGDGDETVGVVRFTGAATWQWILRNSNSGGNGDVTVSFGEFRVVAGDQLGSIPVAGNFDPADDAYEIGVVLYQPSGVLSWRILPDLDGSEPPVGFTYGRTTDYPVVGDWDGDGDDTAGVVRGPNRWLLNDANLAGGAADRNFAFGSAGSTVPELPVTGDWDGNGTDTPAVLRNIPATEVEGPYQRWIFRNANSGGPASGSFVFGGAAQTVDLPIDVPPRLAVEVS